MAKKKAIPVQEPVADFGDFVVYNPDKLHRAINGSTTSRGSMEGGVGKDASPEAILAEYDRLGGLIKTKGGQKVAIGSFYDFEAGKPRKEPTVELDEKPNEGGLNIVTENVGDDEKPKKKKKRSPADED